MRFSTRVRQQQALANSGMRELMKEFPGRHWHSNILVGLVAYWLDCWLAGLLADLPAILTSRTSRTLKEAENSMILSLQLCVSDVCCCAFCCCVSFQ